jgi:hypothetical protein
LVQVFFNTPENRKSNTVIEFISASVLGIKGVHYIGSVQPLLGIWKTTKRLRMIPMAVSIEWLGNIPTCIGEYPEE